jgi:type IV secretory pathway VirB6-like protein
MGQNLFNFISGQCDTLAATTSPGIDAIGLHIVLALATIMMVWFGVQEALSAAQGGPGFNMAKFLNFFLLITFAYSMVKFYDSSIPGLGFSLKSFVIQGTDNLQQVIGNDANDQMLASIDKALAGSGTSTPTLNIFSGFYVAICYVFAQIDLVVLDAVCALILSYGAVAGTIVGMLGPIFIPFLVFEKTEFLFWGWLKAFLSFEFFKVVAAATLSLVAHMYMSQAGNISQMFTDPVNAVKAFPILLLLTIVSVYIILKIPAITVSIFSGSAGGHDAGIGTVTAVITQGLLRG